MVRTEWNLGESLTISCHATSKGTAKPQKG